MKNPERLWRHQSIERCPAVMRTADRRIGLLAWLVFLSTMLAMVLFAWTAQAETVRFEQECGEAVEVRAFVLEQRPEGSPDTQKSLFEARCPVTPETCGQAQECAFRYETEPSVLGQPGPHDVTAVAYDANGGFSADSNRITLDIPNGLSFTTVTLDGRPLRDQEERSELTGQDMCFEASRPEGTTLPLRSAFIWLGDPALPCQDRLFCEHVDIGQGDASCFSLPGGLPAQGTIELYGRPFIRERDDPERMPYHAGQPLIASIEVLPEAPEPIPAPTLIGVVEGDIPLTTPDGRDCRITVQEGQLAVVCE